MILGIAGVLPCPGPLAGIPAVICGHLARSQIRKSGGQIAGKGLAVAGLAMGYFSLVWIIAWMAAITIPFLHKSHRVSPRSYCLANLKVIEGAKTLWAQESKKQPSEVPQAADLFGPDKAISAKPKCPEGGIYTLNAVSESPQCSVHGGLSRLGASP